MKNTVITLICNMLISNGVDVDRIQDKLFMILKDYEIRPIETQIAIRDETINERLVKHFIAAKRVKGCTERTIRRYGTEIPKALFQMGKPATDITADDIRLYIALRLQRDKVLKGTANGELLCLRSFFGFLLAEEYITKNPTLKIDRIKSEKKQKEAFTEMECEKLRAACKTAHERAVIEMLLSTGCRVTELVGIRIDDIEGDRTIVHGKGEKDRYVYLNAKALYAVESYLSERSDTNPYLFPAAISSRLTTQAKGPHDLLHWYKNPELIGEGKRHSDSIGDLVRKIGKRAGVEKTHPHKFRRTCATMALYRGMPVEQISKMLGHESLATTQIYLDLNEDELKHAHKKYVV